MSTNTVYDIERLRKLQHICGADEDATTTTTATNASNALFAPPLNHIMTPFEAQRYVIGKKLLLLRQRITELDSSSSSQSSVTAGVLARQKIRQDLTAVKSDVAAIAKAAAAEDRKDEFNEVKSQVLKVEDQYRSRFRTAEMTEALQHSATTGVSGRSGLAIEMDDLSRVGQTTSIRDDEEFAECFTQMKSNDMKIEEAVDILTLGVGRLKMNSEEIHDTVELHRELLSEADRKVETSQVKLKEVNKKLKWTIVQVDRSNCGIYIFCTLLLAVLVLIIIYMATAPAKSQQL